MTSIVLSFALTLGGSTIAVAAPAPADAEALISKGVELRRKGMHAEAYEAFQKAHLADPSPRTLGQLGLAEQTLKKWVDSELHLTQALASPDFPWVARNRKPLEQALAAVKTHVGEVHVNGPRGARVRFDERDVGTLPLTNPVRVAEGTTTIRVELEAHQPFERTLNVPGGGALTLDANLTPLKPAVAEPLVPTGLSPIGADQPERNAKMKRIAGWSLLGVSAAAIGTGIAFLVVDNDETCTKSSPNAICPRLYDTKLQGWIAVGAGVAAGAAGGFMLWKSSRTEVALTVLPNALVATGRF
jgi:hypothetical protein